MPFEVTAYIPTVKPGAYQAVCTSVTTKAVKDDPSNEFRVWEFTLRDGTGRTVGASSSLSTTPKSKGGKWIAALIGHAPQIGEMVEPVGQACTIIVAIKDTTGYEYVETIAPPEQGAPASRPPVIETVTAAEKAAEQHAIQEGDELP